MFHEECVGPKRETIEGRLFDTLDAQIARNGDTGKRLVMKVDVEGAEWPSLLSMSDAALQQIDQLSVEFHGVEEGTTPTPWPASPASFMSSISITPMATTKTQSRTILRNVHRSRQCWFLGRWQT